MKNTVRLILVTMILVAAQVVTAGLWDSIKKVGSDIADTAGNVAGATVNFTTSTVHSVKQRTVFADPQTNATETAQSNPTPAEVPTVTQTVSTAETSAPAPTPAVQPSAPAPVSAPSSVPVSVPQAAERKTATAADDGDNLFSRKKHRKEKHQQHSEGRQSYPGDGNPLEQQYKAAIDYLKSETFIKQLDELVKLDTRGNRYGEDARSGVYEKIQVRDYGITDEVTIEKLPSIPDYCKKLGGVRIPSGLKEDALKKWKEILQSNIEKEKQYMAQKSVENNIRKFIEEELKPRCAEYNKAKKLAYKIYPDKLGPQHPYVVCKKEEWGTTKFGHSHDDGHDEIYCLYDLDGWKHDSVSGRKFFQSGNDSQLTKELGDKWISHARKWLERNDRLLSWLNGDGVTDEVKAFYAKTMGTNAVPFNVYRGITFGSTILDVYGELEKLAQKNGENSFEWGKGTVGRFLNGCAARATVKPHDVQFTFGAFAADEIPVLTAMTMKFTGTAPSVDALLEKYGKMDGAKVERKSEIVKRIWPETEIGQFWKMLATAVETKTAQNCSQGDVATLKKDVEAIHAAHSKPITREKVKVTIGRVEIAIEEDSQTHAVSEVFFEDTLLSAKLKELCVKQKEADEKAAADAKAAMEKKAKAAAVDF